MGDGGPGGGLRVFGARMVSIGWIIVRTGAGRASRSFVRSKIGRSRVVRCDAQTLAWRRASRLSTSVRRRLRNSTLGAEYGWESGEYCRICMGSAVSRAAENAERLPSWRLRVWIGQVRRARAPCGLEGPRAALRVIFSEGRGGWWPQGALFAVRHGRGCRRRTRYQSMERRCGRVARYGVRVGDFFVAFGWRDRPGRGQALRQRCRGWRLEGPGARFFVQDCCGASL